MRKLLALALVLSLVIILGACGGKKAAPQPEPVKKTEEPAKKAEEPAKKPEDPITQKDLRFSHAGQKHLDYGASLIGWKELPKIGYTFDRRFAQRSELATQALIQGDVDIAQNNPDVVIQAIVKGANVAIISGFTANGWVIVSRSDIKEPKDLAGKKIAVHSEQSMSNTVVQHTIKKYGVQGANILIVPGSANRAQAMISGQVDATSVFVSDFVRLDLEQPGKFRILVDFTDLKVNGAVMAARKDWIATHQRELRDVIKNLFLGARKANADPAWAVEQLKPEFPDENPVFLEAAIKEYASRKVWAPSGAMTKPDDLKEAIAFLKEAGMLDKSAPDDPNFYVDFKALDAVLAEIGVQ